MKKYQQISRDMKAIKILIITFFCTTTIPAVSAEIGVGYGKELRGNTDLDQYELFYRQSLPFKRQFDSGLKLLSALEYGAAMINESDSDNDPAGRFSVMPQVIFDLHPNVNMMLGLGAGFMVGNTEFTEHNLGGEFLLNSKVGIQFLLGQHWNIGYFYYHQSNAGIYEFNASLNMHSLGLSYLF